MTQCQPRFLSLFVHSLSLSLNIYTYTYICMCSSPDNATRTRTRPHAHTHTQYECGAMEMDRYLHPNFSPDAISRWEWLAVPAWGCPAWEWMLLQSRVDLHATHGCRKRSREVNGFKTNQVFLLIHSGFHLRMPWTLWGQATEPMAVHSHPVGGHPLAHTSWPGFVIRRRPKDGHGDRAEEGPGPPCDLEFARNEGGGSFVRCWMPSGYLDWGKVDSDLLPVCRLARWVCVLVLGVRGGAVPFGSPA